MDTCRIFISHHDKLNRLNLIDLLFIEAHRNHCRLVTIDNDFRVNVPLGKLEPLLPQEQFIRIHRSYIVNLDRIDSISKMMESINIQSYVLPISRRKRGEISSKINVLS